MSAPPVTASHQSVSQLLKALGPGLLFAGAAIGVSHLVQSTRAGALYGLGLIGVVLVANASKYPGLSLGTRYTNATGHSLLEAYRRQGKWALGTFLVLTLGTMFTVAAAVSFVTGALLQQLVLRYVAPGLPLPMAAAVVLVIVGVLLRTGGFKWLDMAMKILLSTLALMTVSATLIALTRLDWSTFALVPPAESVADKAAIGFVVALAGWMPGPMDISIWNSVWAQAQCSQRGRRATFEETRFDFNLGYVLCVVLALCFLVLGTVSYFQPGLEPAKGGVAFAQQVIGLFTDALGPWAYPVVAVCAFAAMFSTTLTVVDAIPRVLMVMSQRFKGPENESESLVDHSKHRGYWIWYAVLMAGTAIVLFFLAENLRQLVDLATTLSFVTAPVFAWLNHRAIADPEVKGAFRPSKAMNAYSLACVAALSLFSLFFLYFRFVL